MKQKETSIFWLAITYLAMFILQVIALPASIWSVFLLIATGLIAWWHMAAAKKRNEKIDWSRINRPFGIIDWGEEGKGFELPARHAGFYIACPASRVEQTVEYVQVSLSNAGNLAYIRSNMPVLHFYFGWRGYVRETPEEYKARVIADMDEALDHWHIKLADEDEKAYIRAFFAGNQNGSVEK